MFGPGPSERGAGYSREGLTTRQQTGYGASQLGVVIDKPYDFDLEVEGLRSQVGRLKQMSYAIGDETRQNKKMAETLDETLEELKSRLRKGMRRLNKAYKSSKSNHWTHLILFIVGAFFLVYCWSSVVRILKWVR